MRLTQIRSAVHCVRDYESETLTVDYIVRAFTVTNATREHEVKAAENHKWRAQHLIGPKDRALGLGKWSSTVSHNVSRGDA